MESKNRRMPAEWEHQRCVQLTWPHAHTDWGPMLADITRVYQQIALEISKREDLLIVAPAEAMHAVQQATATNERPPRTLACPTNDTWARDHGFITVVDSPASTQQTSSPILLDFCFNGWGEKFPADLDNQINRRLYDQGLLSGTYESHLDFVLEGGSIESDGRGTVFTTACCLLAPHRNQPLGKEQIEVRLKQYLGAQRIVWLQHGSLIGDDTDGHIDTLVRICPDDTLLYTAGDADHPDLARLEQELTTLRTVSGQPYRMLRLPLPRPIHDDGQRLPATYANYLVINGAVLVPTYGQPDLDRQAIDVIRQAYPDRDIVGIDCLPVIRQHGSLHCCTMQYPVGVIPTETKELNFEQ